MLKHLCRKQHQNNKIQTLRKKKQIEMNSPDFQKDEIITLQIQLIKILLEESTLRSRKEMIQKKLEEYQHYNNGPTKPEKIN